MAERVPHTSPAKAPAWDGEGAVEPLVLAMDTATDYCSIALGLGGQPLASTVFEAGRMHLEMLLPETHSLLERHSRRASEIRAIAVGTGPGTFTGLRVGVATARAMAQALGVPLFGSGSLPALAMGIAASLPTERAAEADILAVIDARRKQVFAAIFRLGEHGADRITETLCLEPPALCAILMGKGSRQMIAAGSGALEYREEFERCPQVEILDPDHEAHRIDAAFHLAAIPARAEWDAGPRNLYNVVPEYVREPDADQNVLKRKQEPWPG